MSDSQSVRAVELSDELLNRIEARLPYTEFGSVQEYLEYVMMEVLHQVEEETDNDMEAVDETEVQDRLKSLGYLNE